MTDDVGDMSLGLESLKGLIAKVLQAAIGFAGTVVFARLLGPTSFGGYYFLLSIVFVADRPVRGFGQAVKKRYSEADAPREELVGSVVLFDAAAILLAGVALYPFGGSLSRATNVEDAVVVFFALFAALTLFYPVQKLLPAAGYPARQIWNDTLRSVLTLPLQLLFVFLGYGAAGLGYGLAAATLLVVPVALAIVRVRPRLPSRETLSSLWTYARYSVPDTFVGAAYGRLDVLVLGTLLTTASVAYYEVAYKLTVPATLLSGVLATALMPKLSKRHSEGRAITADVGNAVSYNSVIAIPVFFGALTLARPLVVTVYGGEYSPAATLLVGLALYQVVWSQTNVYQETLAGLDRPGAIFWIDLITLLFNVVVGIWLALEYGPIGVVVATVAAEAVRYAASAWTITRHVDVSLLPRPVLEQVASALVMAVAVEAVKLGTTVRSWVDLGLVVAVGAAVYWLCLFVVSSNFRVLLMSVYDDATS